MSERERVFKLEKKTVGEKEITEIGCPLYCLCLIARVSWSIPSSSVVSYAVSLLMQFIPTRLRSTATSPRNIHCLTLCLHAIVASSSPSGVLPEKINKYVEADVILEDGKITKGSTEQIDSPSLGTSSLSLSVHRDSILRCVNKLYDSYCQAVVYCITKIVDIERRKMQRKGNQGEIDSSEMVKILQKVPCAYVAVGEDVDIAHVIGLDNGDTGFLKKDS
jgi:hypothetical protein